MPTDDQRYPPISEYALLADCHSAALVSRAGSIDWACLRRFDAPSVFGRLLDWDRGGHFGFTVPGEQDRSRSYVGDSLVVRTDVRAAGGRVRFHDALVMRPGGERRPYHQLVRTIEGVDGAVEVDVDIQPRFDYGELRPWTQAGEQSEHGCTYTAVGGSQALVVDSPVALDVDDEVDRISGRLQVRAGDRLAFSVRSQLPHLLDASIIGQAELHRRLEQTVAWWARWSENTAPSEFYAEAIRRSATVLKGLTCAPTGGMVAAPTTSLPERVGGERNWDYRYTWVRDATLTLSALSIAGHPDVAHGFRDFLLRTAAGSAADLQIMYGVYGERHLPEYHLRLSGWRDSRPVRVGNAAARQTQHDMYGQILDAAHLWRRAPHPGEAEEIDPDEWRFLRQVVNRAITVIDKPDHGLWEVRGPARHFVHSKVLLWVAVDRGVRTAEETGLACPELGDWHAARGGLRTAIDAHGVHPRDGHYVQQFGGTEVDAALLQLPMLGFVAADDPRMLATVAAVERDLAVPPDGFVRRYRTEHTDDGLAGSEATFLMCSFWLADVLAMQGRRDDATALFERLLAVGNDLGLFAEEYDAASGQLMGNFPQAFTHLALVNAAHQIGCAQGSPCAHRVWSLREEAEVLHPSGSGPAGETLR